MGEINDDSAKSLGKALGKFFAIFGAIIIPVCIYISRSLVAQMMAFTSIYWVIPIAIGLVVGLLVCIVVATIYTLGWRSGWLNPRYTNLPRLLLAILGSSLIAYFSPLVSTPEQLYFNQHQSEFAHHVERIKKGESIDHFNNLKIRVSYNAQVIVFEFNSDELNTLSSYAYVYAEKYSDLDALSMCSKSYWKFGEGGYIYATLRTNWYLCYRSDDWL